MSTIDCHPIKAYQGAINVNVVIGTSFQTSLHRLLMYMVGTQAINRKMDIVFENHNTYGNKYSH